MSERTLAVGLLDAVYVKTPLRTFNLFFYFALDAHGRIWVKSISGASRDTESVAPDWQLFLGTGLPHDDARPDFAGPRRITSINADLDELMAVSEEGRHFSLRWLENPIFEEDTPVQTWADQHGWPVAGALVWDARVANNRGWAIGRRTRTFVMFEDVVGRSFDGGGGLSTYYVLSADGTSIAFSDSGLPPDFSHTIDTPERSTFIAETMQVCADTIFVINAYGELFTRMVDFDTNGADTMFFIYTYDRADPRPDAIALPAEDWFAHKSIALTGHAQISSRIAIVLTGKHNRDRELRVAGFDPGRQPGYYAKRIFDQADGSPVREDLDDWRFVLTPGATIDAAALLDPVEATAPRRARVRDMAFHGELHVADKLVAVAVAIPNFHLDCSPAQLRFTCGTDSIEVALHTVEKWYHLTREDPGHDSTPKIFHATLELPEQARTTESPALRNLIAQVLAPLHLIAFALSAQATEDYLEITREGAAPAISLRLTRDERAYPSFAAAKRDSLRQDRFSARARDPRLQLALISELTPAEAPWLVIAMGDNLRVASELAREAEAPERQDAATPRWLRPSVLGLLRFAARPWLIGAVLPALPFRNLSNAEAAYYAHNLAASLPPLLRANRALKDSLLGHARQDLRHALSVIDTRIAAYRLRLAELRSARLAKPCVFFEAIERYWDAFRFGERAVLPLRPRVSANPGWRCTVSDDAFYDPAKRAISRRRAQPGLRIYFQSKPTTGPDDEVWLGVTLTRLERDCFRASTRRAARVGSLTNPLVTPVLVRAELATGTPCTRALLASLFDTRRLAARQELPAELVIRGDHFSIESKSLAIEWRR